MNNKVYYGKYSLKHWIDLILKKSIILPAYQRYFVWKQKDVEKLIQTLKEKQFVPPVTIGAFKYGNVTQNLILDGQQRLTSIFLAYIGLFPDETIYKKALEIFVNDNDEEEEEEEIQQLDNILEWNIKILTEKGRSKETIISNIIEGNYKNVDFHIDEDFLKTTFLGFSYLVPQVTDENQQQKYYSSVFRNINIEGKALLAQESRAALYFLDQNLVPCFAPDFCKSIVVKVVNTETKADFVRYLSMLSQYHQEGNAGRVARSYKPKMEKYYEEYIYAAINDINSQTYGKFSTIFPNKEYQNDLSRLETNLNDLEIPKNYSSIIDLDTYLFGLIYQVIFRKKEIDVSKKVDLKHELNNKILSYKAHYSHKKSPNNLGHLRNRINTSVYIYSKYILNEA